VFVYKLIAAGTVEEKIVELQARKAELAAPIFSPEAATGGVPLAKAYRVLATKLARVASSEHRNAGDCVRSRPSRFIRRLKG
jgi:hypothetical protein